MASPPQSLPSPLFLLLSLFLTLASSSKNNQPGAAAATTATITLSLTPFTKASPTISPWQRLNYLASSSIGRAHYLKHRQKNSSLTKIPLFPQSYGGYTISLSFGTPPQTLPFIMDTGSSLVWFPCTKRYLCGSCNVPNLNPANISTFVPKLSSSAKNLGCNNPKCRWIFGQNVECPACDDSSGNCTRICPLYTIQYGSGATAGILLSETLDFPDKLVEDFVVGCSIFSVGQPSGIAGFGRGPESLPAQLGVKKFSYCLVSHRFDGTTESSDLLLDGGSNSSGLSYTPLLKNTMSKNSAFENFYYVGLRKITVGGKRVKVRYSYLVPGVDGNGGTIVDSGTALTVMGRKVFEPVALEFEKQLANYSRAADVENQSGLSPCFNVSGQKSVLIPELMFHFRGGAKMALPAANYFSFVGGDGVCCLTILTDGVGGSETSVGPSIILGNYQQQNFIVEYDLEGQRLGFRKQICK